MHSSVYKLTPGLRLLVSSPWDGALLRAKARSLHSCYKAGTITMSSNGKRSGADIHTSWSPALYSSHRVRVELQGFPLDLALSEPSEAHLCRPVKLQAALASGLEADRPLTSSWGTMVCGGSHHCTHIKDNASDMSQLTIASAGGAEALVSLGLHEFSFVSNVLWHLIS